MNKLTCHVESCTHNEAGGCCLNSIKVEGPAANCSKETVCGSYAHRGAASNSASSHHDVKPVVNISCSAAVCTYNKSEKCVSDAVCINCNCGCGERSECSTFRL